MTTEQKLAEIGRLYDKGASLVAIVANVGTSDEDMQLIGQTLGLSRRPGCNLDYARREALQLRHAYDSGVVAGARAYAAHVAGKSRDEIEADRDTAEAQLRFAERGWYGEGFDIGYDQAAEA
jgi:hypothetical protein